MYCARLFVETYPNFANGLILTGTGQYPKWKNSYKNQFEINFYFYWEAQSFKMGQSTRLQII